MSGSAWRWLVPALLLCLAFAGLGVWQLKRGERKERLLEGWRIALAEAPRDYSNLLEGRDRLPRREDLSPTAAEPALPLAVRLQGRWDPSLTVLLDNQHLDGAVGVFVLTRFVPEGSATPLLINRGWLPMPPDRRPPMIPQPSDGLLSLHGLLVPPPAVGIQLAAPEWSPGAAPPLLLALDLPVLRGKAGPLFEGMLLLAPDGADGFTRRWRPLPNTLPPEKHRGYAVQWFALSVAVAVLYFLLALRRT